MSSLEFGNSDSHNCPNMKSHNVRKEQSPDTVFNIQDRNSRMKKGAQKAKRFVAGQLECSNAGSAVRLGMKARLALELPYRIELRVSVSRAADG